MKGTELLIYWYMRIQQYYKISKNLFWINLGVKEIIIYNNKKSKNVILRYLFCRFLSYIIKIIKKFQNKIEIKTNLVSITKIYNNGEKIIIMEKDSLINSSEVKNYINLMRPNYNMLNYVIMNFDLINSNTEIINLSEYIIKYQDIEEKFNHSLKNILLLNKIEHNENSKIFIKIYKNKKISTFTYLLNEVYDKHINNFML